MKTILFYRSSGLIRILYIIFVLPFVLSACFVKPVISTAVETPFCALFTLLGSPNSCFRLTRAQYQTYAVESIMTEWNKIKNTNDIKEIFNFVKDESSFSFNWVEYTYYDLNIEGYNNGTFHQLIAAQNKYNKILPEIHSYIPLYKAYKAVFEIPSNQNIDNLINITKNSSNPIYSQVLNITEIKPIIDRYLNKDNSITIQANESEYSPTVAPKQKHTPPNASCRRFNRFGETGWTCRDKEGNYSEHY